MSIKRRRIVGAGRKVAGGQVRPITVACWSELGVERSGVETTMLPPAMAAAALPHENSNDAPLYPTHVFWRTDGQPLVRWSPNDDEHEISVHRLFVRCTRSDAISPVRASSEPDCWGGAER